MSVMIVSDLTIHRVLVALMTYEELDLNAVERAELGQALKDLNVRSYTDKYGTVLAENGEEPFAYRLRLPDLPIVLYKATRCFMYQIEGDAHDTELYERVEAAYDALAHDCVSGSEAYERSSGWE